MLFFGICSCLDHKNVIYHKSMLLKEKDTVKGYNKKLA